MSVQFDDHHDFDLARQLRRAAGATPDVYVAYDTVIARVGAVRRRRRVAVSGTAGFALLLAAGTYALSLGSPDRSLQQTADSAEATPSTTDPVEVRVSSTLTITTSAVEDGAIADPDGPPIESTDTDPTLAPTTHAPATIGSDPDASDDAVATTTGSVDATEPTAPPTAAAPTTRPPKPPQTTVPPLPPTEETEPTVPPTDPTVPTVETTLPPVTVPPTQPTAPPTTVPTTEETLPTIPFLTKSDTFDGNTVSVVYQGGLLTIVTAQAGEGYTLAGQESMSAKKVRATFVSELDTITLTVVVDGVDIRFKWEKTAASSPPVGDPEDTTPAATTTSTTTTSTTSTTVASVVTETTVGG